MVVRGSACDAASCTSRGGNSAHFGRSDECVPQRMRPDFLRGPARRATRRTIRPAPCMSSRCAAAVRKIGPSQRSPTARSIAPAVPGASGMTAFDADPRCHVSKHARPADPNHREPPPVHSGGSPHRHMDERSRRVTASRVGAPGRAKTRRGRFAVRVRSPGRAGHLIASATPGAARRRVCRSVPGPRCRVTMADVLRRADWGPWCHIAGLLESLQDQCRALRCCRVADVPSAGCRCQVKHVGELQAGPGRPGSSRTNARPTAGTLDGRRSAWPAAQCQAVPFHCKTSVATGGAVLPTAQAWRDGGMKETPPRWL